MALAANRENPVARTWRGRSAWNARSPKRELAALNHILTYDLRNHGMSGTGNGGLCGLGLLECRDVVGSLRYAKPHVKALVLLNVVSGRTFIERGAENLRLDPERAAARLDERVRELTGFRLDEQTPLPYAPDVTVPTLQAQLRRDFLVHERDGQAIFDALGAREKELLWIEESNQRFYAYNYFGQHPERLVGWFDRHL
jgi:hypothetical protein